MIVRLLAFWALFVVCVSQAAAQSYDYDERGRLERVTYSDCSTIRYFYDASGNRTERIVLAGDGSCAGNQAPLASDDVITMAPGATGLFDLLAAHGSGSADDDPDDDDIRIVSVTQGTVPQSPSGALGVQLQDDRRQVRITAPSSNGSYAFSYEIEDALGLTDQAAVSLVVQQATQNLAPVANDDEGAQFTVRAGTTVALPVVVNDTDENPNALSIVEGSVSYRHPGIDGVPANATISPDGRHIIYVGNSTPTRPTHLYYKVTDGALESNRARVRILNISSDGSNSPPVAVADVDLSGFTITGASALLNVMANDYDPDGDSISLVPGSLSVSPATATVSVEGDEIRLDLLGGGSDSYQINYKIQDANNQQSSEATASVSVPILAHAIPDYSNAQAGQWITVDVLQNDGGENLELVSVQADDAANDAEVLTGLARVRATEASGQATFTYELRASQSGVTDTGTLTLDVNRRPTVPDMSRTVQPNESVVLDVIAQASDLDGDTVELTSAYIHPVYMNGHVERINNDTAIRFTAPATEGRSVVSFRVDDGRGGTRNYDATMTVESPPNICPVARNDSVTFNSGQTGTIDVLGNDTDADGPRPDLVSVGSVSGGGAASKSGDDVSFSAPTGPAISTFTYDITDGECQRSATVTVTTNAPANRPPTPGTVSNTGLTQGQEVWVGIPLTGIDPDGDTVTLESVSNGNRGGSAQRHASHGHIIRVWSSASKGQWEDFTYTVSDGVNPPVSATLRVRVDNYRPSPVRDSYTFFPNQTRTLTDILSNDSDPDGDSLSIERVYSFSGGGAGSVVNGGQAVEYTAPSSPGSASFWVVIIDPNGGYKAQRVDITVSSPFDPPCGGGILCP